MSIENPRPNLPEISRNPAIKKGIGLIVGIDAGGAGLLALAMFAAGKPEGIFPLALAGFLGAVAHRMRK